MPTMFDVPEGALWALRLSPNEFAKEMRIAAALLWYSQGEISQSAGCAHVHLDVHLAYVTEVFDR